MSQGIVEPQWDRRVAAKQGLRMRQRRNTQRSSKSSATNDYSTAQCVRKRWEFFSNIGDVIEVEERKQSDEMVVTVFVGNGAAGKSLNFRWPDAKKFPDSTSTTKTIPAGSVTYYLRRPLRWSVTRNVDGTWKYSVEGFSPQFEGVADSIANAKLDFQNQVHTSFQSLVHSRPFQMNATQDAKWQTLENLIDVDRYWSTIPVKLIEIGVISRVDAQGREVIWLDGERREIISIEQSTPDFAAFEVGQWFEALVERSPKTYELRELCYVQTIDPVHEMDEQEFRAWIDRLPSAETLPESDTTWATL